MGSEERYRQIVAFEKEDGQIPAPFERNATNPAHNLDDGAFQPEELVDFFLEITEKAHAQGVLGLRIVIDMAWVLESEPDIECLLRYGKHLNGYLENSPGRLLCLYQRDEISPKAVRNAILIHPIVIHKGRAFENIHHLPSNINPERPAAERVVDWMLSTLRERRYSKSRLQELLNVLNDSPVAVLVWRDEPGLPVETASENVHRILGYDPDDFEKGRIRYLDLVHPEDRVYVSRALENLRASGTGQERLEHRLYTSGNVVRWVELLARTSGKKGTRRLRAVLLDITHERRLQKELVTTSDRLSLATEAAGLGVWDWDLQRGEIFYDEQLARMYGMPPESGVVDREDWLGLVFPEDRALILAAGRDAIDEDGHFRSKFRVRRPDNTVRFMASHALVQRDDKGEAERMIGVNIDVTEEELSKKKLEESEHRYRLLAENTLDLIWQMDLELTFVYVNPAVHEMFGYTVEEFVDSPLSEHCSASHFQEIKEIVWAELESPGDHRGLHFETEFLHRDGFPVPVEARAKILRDDEGRPRGVQGTARDITERLAALRREESLEQQLYQAQKMQAVGRLAGGVAHDFNNLLSVVLGFSELLQEDLDPESVHQDPVKEIYEAAFRAKQLTSKLLAFGRKQMLEFKVVDINQVIFAFERLLRRIIGEDIELVMDLEPSIPPVKADVGQLEQVLLNLAVNARDAMPEGGTLTLTTDLKEQLGPLVEPPQGDTSNAFVVIKVADTGIGIEGSDLEHIFEPFFSTKGEEGTGLGLATVYGIVKQHGGTIDVTSRKGEWTTFEIFFPITEPAGVDSGEREQEKLEPYKTPSKEATILVVEDESAVKNLILKLLRRRRYNTLSASSAEEAQRLLQESTPALDLVITDVVLPEMSGPQLFQEIRSLQPGIPGLFISGYSEELLTGDKKIPEGVKFVSKPFAVDAFLATVSEMLD